MPPETTTVMCCTDGDTPMGTCTRPATTLRPVSFPGPTPAPPDAEQYPVCQQCADNTDAWSRMEYIKAVIEHLQHSREYPELTEVRIKQLDEEYDQLNQQYPL